MLLAAEDEEAAAAVVLEAGAFVFASGDFAELSSSCHASCFRATWCPGVGFPTTIHRRDAQTKRPRQSPRCRRERSSSSRRRPSSAARVRGTVSPSNRQQSTQTRKQRCHQAPAGAEDRAPQRLCQLKHCCYCCQRRCLGSCASCLPLMACSVCKCLFNQRNETKRAARFKLACVRRGAEQAATLQISPNFDRDCRIHEDWCSCRGVSKMTGRERVTYRRARDCCR